MGSQLALHCGFTGPSTFFIESVSANRSTHASVAAALTLQAVLQLYVPDTCSDLVRDTAPADLRVAYVVCLVFRCAPWAGSTVHLAQNQPARLCVAAGARGFKDCTPSCRALEPTRCLARRRLKTAHSARGRDGTPHPKN